MWFIICGKYLLCNLHLSLIFHALRLSPFWRTKASSSSIWSHCTLLLRSFTIIQLFLWKALKMVAHQTSGSIHSHVLLCSQFELQLQWAFIPVIAVIIITAIIVIIVVSVLLLDAISFRFLLSFHNKAVKITPSSASGNSAKQCVRSLDNREFLFR